MRTICLPAFALCLFCVAAYAQETQSAPRLVRFNGALRPANGAQATPSIESVTMAVYREETGGAPLWEEIQNVALDAEGRYSLLMGATRNEGVPAELFVSGEPRWLGARVNRPGEVEQSRVLLVHVPYALKAVDSDTLGGRPASAYMLAGANSTGSSAAAATPATSTKAVKPRVNAGSSNFIGKFVNSTDLVNSALFENAGLIGVGTGQPLIGFDVRAGAFPQLGAAQTQDYLSFFASDQFGPAIYWDPAKDMRFGKGGAALYNPFGFVEQMRIQSSTGNVGIGTPAPTSKLDVAGDVNFDGILRFQGNQVLKIPGGPGALNTAVGLSAMASNTTGGQNSAFGFEALNSNTTGAANVSTGAFSLLTNTTGTANTATGFAALSSNTTASNNTATGFQALSSNTTGVSNTANGAFALEFNTTASGNTATGYQTLRNNTTGSQNSAYGVASLESNTTGLNNTAIGSVALSSNTTGNANTATGFQALLSSSTGGNNTAIGSTALASNTIGFNNTALGASALFLNTGGSNNIAIGVSAAISVSTGNNNNIHIGNPGGPTDSGAIKIGTSGIQTSFFAAGIRGVTTGVNNAIPVMIDGNGQLGTVSSSRRFKEDIADMGDASSGLMQLRPVIYRYKQPFSDGTKPIQYGLIAEEVAEVYPDLVAHSADGQIETVKYQVLDSMLLNEVQRLQRDNQSLQERLEKVEAMLGSLSAASKTSTVK